jgi:hypothetical protein
MTSAAIALQRLSQQRLVQQPFATPYEVVRWMGATQAQDYLASLWALGLRVHNATEQTVEQAIAERKIVRTWPMRGTVHFVPAEDTRWMVNLMAQRVIKKMQGVYRQIGLDDATFARSRAIFEQALTGGKVLKRSHMYKLLEANGIATDNIRGTHIIGYLSQHGVICSGPREGKQPTVTLLDEWVPHLNTPTHEESLATMALRYFQSHGPATLQDFVWWSGLLTTDAREGLEAVKSQLVEETIDGSTYWFAEPMPSRSIASPMLHMLPAFDEYMVSYKDRSAALDPHNRWMWEPMRHLNSIVVIDGMVIGSWKRIFKKDQVAIEATLTRSLTSSEDEAFEASALRYAAFVGRPLSLATITVLSSVSQ